MKFRLEHTSNLTKMIIIGEFFLVSYLLYTLTVSIYKSYQIDLHIKNYEEENTRIEEEIRNKAEELEYHNSPAYAEKIAKQNLGLVNPGEEVIIIPNDGTDFNGQLPTKTTDTEDTEDSTQDLSNPQKWWKFFFDIPSQKT